MILAREALNRVSWLLMKLGCVHLQKHDEGAAEKKTKTNLAVGGHL